MDKNQTQNQIIRQSQIKLALDYFNTCEVCPTIVDLIKVTAMLENFIVNGYKSTEVSNYEALDKYIQEQYKGVK